MAKRYFDGEYVGLDGVAYSGYYTVEDGVVVKFTTDDGEEIDPVGATLDEVMTFTELTNDPENMLRIVGTDEARLLA